MTTDLTPDAVAAGLCAFVDASPSPFHATAEAGRQLAAAGFVQLPETDSWPRDPGRYFLIRAGSLVAWNSEHATGPATPFRVVAAHTDSPNLRIKPLPDHARVGFQLLGVEVYGGPLLSSWLDRDLGLAGRVGVRDGAGVDVRLLRIDEPLLRISQLAIHLNRAVNTEGLVLNPQQHLAPHWALGEQPGDFVGFLGERLGLPAADVLSWDLMTYDLTPSRVIGRDRAEIAAPRLDNLTTSYAGTRALIAAASTPPAEPLNQVLVLFDHEEVGSTSARGAASSLLISTLERIVLVAGGDREDLHRALAGSVIGSGDAGHATHPNYPERHEPQHHVRLNGGPVLKVNNNLRYTSDTPGSGVFRLACEQAGVPMQTFVTRSDLPCGSTVGPMIAASTGATTVDFGISLLSMHSIRELGGVADQAMYVDALTALLSPQH